MVRHEYPDIGEQLPGSVACVERIIELGWDVVLFTARSGSDLEEAVAWCEARFELFAVNCNPYWDSPPSKPSFDLVIDDVAVGTPLDANGSVDWPAIWPMIERRMKRGR